ncbi:transporter substrate-binding domain-containing protein [bacterium LRH843]|nr:transporter substrate-binding domain-containing protein [bacterium LRH843]
MMSKKCNYIFLLFIAAILVLSGCSPTEKASGEATANKLEQIIKSGKLRVATYPDVAGWSLLNASGEYEGYDPDIARKLAADLGVEVEFVSADSVNRIPLLEADKVDVAIAIFTPTNERAKSVSFTIPYAAAGIVPIFPKGTPIKEIDDIADMKIAFARGNTSDVALSAKFPNAEFVRFDAVSDAFMAMKSGKADVFVDEQAVVAEILKSNPEFEAMPGEPYQPQYISMGVQHGQHDWLNYLNNFIRNFNYSGENAEQYEKWFGTPLPTMVTY